jgi:hypothetical protein
MNQFQSKQTMKKKIGGGFFGRIARSFHARKESKCKRKADDIINTCIIHNNENNNANPYTNISLCIYPDGNFYYVNHNKRRYIYHKSLMSKEFWDISHTFFETAHNNKFSYIFITTKEEKVYNVNNNSKEYRYTIKMVDRKSFGNFANLLCISCDMFGLIPNDAYSKNINKSINTIENWSEFISKKEVQHNNMQLPDDKYLINYLS